MSLISVKQLSLFYIHKLIQRTYEMKELTEKPLTGKILVTYFCEPSTRTSASFQSAMIRLGGSVISLQGEYSSQQKGESLEDSIQTLSSYGDAIVLRHPEKGSSERANKVSSIPIINAGDGNGEHPTQALLDIFTIYDELLKRNISLYDTNRRVINITFVGDLTNSRTVHSLIHILSFFQNINIITEINDEILKITDVLYVTRIQKERYENIDEYNKINSKEKFCLNEENIKLMKEDSIVLHPLPRLQEISTSVDNDKRCVYFKQVENGVYVRMAILEEIIK